MTGTKTGSFTGSPIRNWGPKLERWRQSFLLMSRVPRNWAVIVTEPGNHTNAVEVKVIPLISEASWGKEEERWFVKLVKILRQLYAHRGQGNKKFDGLTLKEWADKIGAITTYGTDEAGRIVEADAPEECSKIIEKLWEAYSAEQAFSRHSQRAFKKALAYHGIRVSYVGSDHGQDEWHRTHCDIRFDVESFRVVCPKCGNENLEQIMTNEYGMHQCHICQKVWPLKHPSR